jgi:hypothetical protein
MKKWVKYEGFSYFSRALGKSDNFLIMFKKGRKLPMSARGCMEYYVATYNKQIKIIEELQEAYFWLVRNRFLLEFGKLAVKNGIYKNERTIYEHSNRWFYSRSNLVDKSTMARWEELLNLFNDLEKEEVA